MIFLLPRLQLLQRESAEPKPFIISPTAPMPTPPAQQPAAAAQDFDSFAHCNDRSKFASPASFRAFFMSSTHSSMSFEDIGSVSQSSTIRAQAFPSGVAAAPCPFARNTVPTTADPINPVTRSFFKGTQKLRTADSDATGYK